LGNSTLCGEAIENINSAVQTFQKKWVMHENNFLKTNLIDNANFGFGTNQARIFDCEFFTMSTGYVENIHIMLRFLCWDDLTNGGVFESRANVSNILGFDLPHDKYQSLKLGYTRAVKKFFTVGGVSKNFLEFFRETKNCNLSKKIRVVLAGKPALPGPVKTQIKNFNNGLGLENDDIPYAHYNLLGAWAYQLAPIEVRIFNFKFFSNKILTNDKKCHFSLDTSAACDFCV
jgi:hypothetical protein